MFNQGIRRVQDMLLENGNKEAVFDVSKLTAFEVTVPSTVDVTQDVTQDERKNQILNAIKKNKNITQDELAEMFNVSKRTIIRWIKEMDNVEYVGSGYSGHWEIKD